MFEFLINLNDSFNSWSINLKDFELSIGIMICMFAIFITAWLPIRWYKKKNYSLLKQKIDILVHEYKMEVTRALTSK